MLVVDASAVVELLHATPAAGRIARRMADHDGELHAPHLLDIEVLSALRRVVASGGASPMRAGEAIAVFNDLPVERYPHGSLIARIWSLRDNFTPYDATYLALAETVTDGGAALLTSDARFARAARAHSGVQVVLEG